MNKLSYRKWCVICSENPSFYHIKNIYIIIKILKTNPIIQAY